MNGEKRSELRREARRTFDRKCCLGKLSNARQQLGSEHQSDILFQKNTVDHQRQSGADKQFIVPRQIIKTLLFK